MKRLFILVMLLPLFASAETRESNNDNDLYHRCAYKSSIYGVAADGRDHGLSPQEVLQSVKEESHVPLKEKKDIINMVFFNRDFQMVSARDIQSTFLNICVGRTKAYEPLK